MLDSRKKLQLALAKRGYMNEDLVNEIKQIYSKQQLPIHGVSKSFKVVDIDLFDYTQITIVNEKEKYIVCHMYTMDNVDIARVRKQAQAMCDALNVC